MLTFLKKYTYRVPTAAFMGMEDLEKPIAPGVYMFFCGSEPSVVLDNLMQHIPNSASRKISTLISTTSIC